MVKKCIVEYDELGNPIGLFDLKEFADIKSLKDFQEQCKKNKKEFFKRQESIKEKAEKERQFVLGSIENLTVNVESLFNAIKELFGVNDIAEIAKILKGENKNEQEN